MNIQCDYWDDVLYVHYWDDEIETLRGKDEEGGFGDGNPVVREREWGFWRGRIVFWTQLGTKINKISSKHL